MVSAKLSVLVSIFSVTMLVQRTESYFLPPECVYPYGPVMPPPVPIPVPVPVPVPPPYGYGYGYGFPAYTGWICKKEAGLDPQIKDVKIEMPELNP